MVNGNLSSLVSFIVFGQYLQTHHSFLHYSLLPLSTTIHNYNKHTNHPSTTSPNTPKHAQNTQSSHNHPKNSPNKPKHVRNIRRTQKIQTLAQTRPNTPEIRKKNSITRKIPPKTKRKGYNQNERRNKRIIRIQRRF